MKKTILLSMLLASSAAMAGVSIEQHELGSGTPGEPGKHEAVEVFNGIFHAPQYMPGYPTAAVLYPRVVKTQCDGDDCDSYNWLPEFGRGEYLMFEAEPKTVIEKEVPVYIERKKKAE